MVLIWVPTAKGLSTLNPNWVDLSPWCSAYGPRMDRTFGRRSNLKNINIVAFYRTKNKEENGNQIVDISATPQYRSDTSAPCRKRF